MSRRRSHFDITPMIDKVQKDIINLCYLGLHQYAKENKLIGRSRPLLNEGMTPYYIRRLFFRLTVACVKQMIDTINWPHGERLEQVNYINVGGYKVLRLYGLLDKDMFLLQRDKGFPLWQGCVPQDDWAHLSQERPLDEIEDFLTLPTRAVLEVGGDHFTKTLRSAMQYIRTEDDVRLHVQYEPKDRLRVRNVAIDLELYDLPYVGRGEAWERVTAIPGRASGRLEVPCHIEKIVQFRDDIYPFVNSLTDETVREKFLYLTKNWPSGEAIQIRHKALQMSQRERERRQATIDAAAEEHDNQIEALRDRFQVHFGDQRPARETDPEVIAQTLRDAATEGPGTETDLEHGDPVADEAVQAAAAMDRPTLVDRELDGVDQDPMPEPTEMCNICNGDWDQCDCCGDCNTTEDECTCWQCAECGEHNDECTCGQCGACGHEECRCCAECNSSPCQCLEREAALTEEENVTLPDEQRQTAIERLRQQVNDVLGD